MRLSYDNITFNSLMDLIDLFPNYDFICNADERVIIMKEKTKDEKNR